MFLRSNNQDPDFPKIERVIDIRSIASKGFGEVPEFVEENRELIEEAEGSVPVQNLSDSSAKNVPVRFEELDEMTNGVVMSQVMASEKRKEKMKAVLEEQFPDLKKAFLEGLLFLLKNLTILSAYLWQKVDNAVRSLKYGGINCDTKFNDEQLFYMAISVPSTIQTASDLLSIFPLMSAKHRYRILEIRKSKLAMFRKIFKKR